MPNARVNIGLVQNSCSSDIEANLAAAIRGIREATARGANIVCLQELFLSAALGMAAARDRLGSDEYVVNVPHSTARRFCSVRRSDLPRDYCSQLLAVRYQCPLKPHWRASLRRRPLPPRASGAHSNQPKIPDDTEVVPPNRQTRADHSIMSGSHRLMVERNPLIQEQGFPFAVRVVGQHQIADLGSYVLDYGFEFGLQQAGDVVLVLGVGVPTAHFKKSET